MLPFIKPAGGVSLWPVSGFANANAVGAGSSLPTFAFSPATPTTLIDTLTPSAWSSVQAGTYTGNQAFPTAAPDGQTTGAKLAVPSGSSVIGAIRSVALGVPFALNDGHFYAFGVYIDAEPPTGMRLDLRLIKETGTPANYKQYSWGKSTNALRKGWNYLIVKGGEDGTVSPHGTWTTTGTVASTDTINRVELRCFSTTDATGYTIYWTKLQRFTSRLNTPTVNFTTDGIQYAGLLTYTLPYAAARNIPMTQSIVTDGLAGNMAALATLKAAGWRFFPQDKSHIDATINGNYSVDLDSAIAAMQANGLVRDPEDIRACSMPYGAANDATRQIAYGKNIRLIRENVTPSMAILSYGPGMGYPMGMQTVDTALLTVAQMQSRLNYWVTYGLSGGFHTHDVVAGGDGTTITGDSEQTYAFNLAAIMDAVVAKVGTDGLIITSPAQLLKSTLALAA